MDHRYPCFEKKVNILLIRLIFPALVPIEINHELLVTGILVRTRPSQHLMHHKFAIIDKKLLLNGSYNWTAQATYGNWENVMITTVPECLVKSYSDHFEYLWSQLVWRILILIFVPFVNFSFVPILILLPAVIIKRILIFLGWLIFIKQKVRFELIDWVALVTKVKSPVFELKITFYVVPIRNFGFDGRTWLEPEIFRRYE